MSNVKIQLRLPESLRDAAQRQAEESGVSMNLFIATTLAARVGAGAEAERYFRTRGARTTPDRAKALLRRLGQDTPPRDDDALDPSGDDKSA